MPAETREAFKASRVQAKVEWKDRLDLPLTVVDEAFMQLINDRYYLTCGQHRLPIKQSSEGAIEVEIHPVVKIVASKAALLKIRDMLNRMLAEE